MAVLNVLVFPNPRLKIVAEEVKNVDENIKKIVADMFETMKVKDGVGLAATQVDIHKRIFVMDYNEKKYCLINPKIIKKEGSIIWNEGCLSFPGVYAKVKRSNKVTVSYLDENGQEQTLEAEEGLMSVCIQHEIDHLDGITFFDHLKPLKQKMLRLSLKLSPRRN